MKTAPTFWWRWLVVACVVTMGFGLALLTLHGLMQDFFNFWLFGEVDGQADYAPARDYLVFTFAVLGGVTFGWGLLLLYVVWIPFRRGERSAWWALALSATLWFLTDSFYSVYLGFGMNAVSNTALYVMFALPLAATYRHFNAPAAAKAA